MWLMWGNKSKPLTKKLTSLYLPLEYEPSGHTVTGDAAIMFMMNCDKFNYTSTTNMEW